MSLFHSFATVSVGSIASLKFLIFIAWFYPSSLRHGDTFDQTAHPQGTEIKAITYSNMQIHEKADKAELYVIVDIWQQILNWGEIW